LAKLHGWAYSLTDDAVWVNVFGSSTLTATLPNGQVINFTQQTDYPWDGKVAITIREAPREPLSIMLRVPDWATGASVAVNGQATNLEAKPGTYLAVRRRWSTGDLMEMSLPMDVVFLQANPLVEEARNQVAVMRGPIVYCLESIDLPDGVNIENVAINPRGRWTPEPRPDLLGGITVLHGDAIVSARQDWTGKLYRRMDLGDAKYIRVKLIPYYAWANRGQSQMAVWLPLGG
jgi:hypothetical protein